jgi:hypothetical protein
LVRRSVLKEKTTHQSSVTDRAPTLIVVLRLAKKGNASKAFDHGFRTGCGETVDCSNKPSKRPVLLLTGEQWAKGLEET